MKMKFFRIRVKLLMSVKEKLIEPSSEASAIVRNLIEGLQNYPQKKSITNYRHENGNLLCTLMKKLEPILPLDEAINLKN